MALHPTLQKQLLDLTEEIFSYEIKYYTHKEVRTTPQEVGPELEGKSWTQIFVEAGRINPPVSSDQKEAKGKPKNYTELERTLTALYCFLSFNLEEEKEAYNAFTDAQYKENTESHLELTPEQSAETKKKKNTKALSDKSFREIRTTVFQTLNHSSILKETICALIVYSDLGKSPETRMRAKAQGIGLQFNPDADDLMGAILKLDDKKIINILPSFEKLKPATQNLLKKIFSGMQTCLGHSFFLESGAQPFREIAQAHLQEDELELILLAQFCDFAGAQGQKTNEGSYVFNENYHHRFKLICEAYRQLAARPEEKLSDEKNIYKAENIFREFLNQSARDLGFTESLSPREEVLIRISYLLKFFDKDKDVTQKKVDLLIIEFDALEEHYKELLITQLGFGNTGLNSWARDAHYVAALPQNLLFDLFKTDGDIKNLEKGIKQAVQGCICLAKMIKEMEKYPLIIHNKEKPVSLDKFAFICKEKKLYENPATFDPTLFAPNEDNIVVLASSLEAKQLFQPSRVFETEPNIFNEVNSKPSNTLQNPSNTPVSNLALDVMPR